MSVRPLRCKRWSCEHCYKARSRDLWHKAFKGLPDMFLTLTMKPDETATPEVAAQAFVDGWRMLRQYLCRTLGRKSLTFLAVFEAHESGMPHLHILLRSKYISRELIKNWWESRTGSWNVDIRRVHNPRQRASYVSKYVASRPAQFGTLKRYWCSQDWDPPKKEAPYTEGDEFNWWESVTTSPISIMRMALGDGAKVTWKGDLMIIERWSSPEAWGIRERRS